MKIAPAALLALASLSAVAVATTADARPRHRSAAPSDVIIVRPRAFTDSGTVVPVGSRSAYVLQSTYFNYQPLERTSPGLLWRPFPYQR